MLGATPTLAAGLLILSCAHGQDAKALIADLAGDREPREAAEVALLQRGAVAGAALAVWLEQMPAAPRSPSQLQQLRSVLAVIDMLGSDAVATGSALRRWSEDRPPQVMTELAHTLTTLLPWVDWDPSSASALFRHVHMPLHLRTPGSAEDDCARSLAAMARHHIRSRRPAGIGTDQLLQRLHRNVLFEREWVADLLGERGEQAAIDPLRAMLIDRNTKPVDQDGLRHRGFPVAWSDEFRLRAAEALLRIAPDDPRCIIAWGCRAQLHPLRGMRRQALARLGQLGPQAAESLPELIQLASADPELAVEALKVVGTVGVAAMPFLTPIEDLAARASGPAAHHARTLAAQLRAMGAVPVPAPAVPPARAAELKGLAAEAEHTERGAAARAALIALGIDALEPLQDRLRREGAKTPNEVLFLLARIGSSLDQTGRDDLQLKIMAANQDESSWSSPIFSGGSSVQPISPAQCECRGILLIPREAEASDLLAWMIRGDPCCRLAAVRRLAEHQELRRSGAAVQSLLDAVGTSHPRTFVYFKSRDIGTEVTVDLDADIHAAAAGALVGAEVPADRRVALLAAVMRYDDPQVIVAGIRCWTTVDSLPVLVQALDASSSAVATAAATAIGGLGTAAASAAPALEQALKSDEGARKVGLQTALDQVCGRKRTK